MDMKINKNIGLNAQVVIDNTVIAHLGANFSTTNMSLNINYNITNKELALANQELVKAKYTEFETEVKAMAADLGYIL